MSTVFVIAAREYVERIKQRGFIIGTILGVLLIVSLTFIGVIGAFFSNSYSPHIALVAPNPAIAKIVTDALTDNGESDRYRIKVMPQRARGSELPPPVESALKSKKYDAGLVAYFDRRGRLAFTYYPRQPVALDSESSVKDSLLSAVIIGDAERRHVANPKSVLSYTFSTVNLNERYKSAAEQSNSQALVYFLLILMYIAVLMYGIYVAQGVIEEKSNRVMELMIGAVRPTQLLAGKILGIGNLAITQLLIIGLASVAIQTAAAAQWGQRLLQSFHTHAAASAPSGISILTVPVSSWIFLLVFFLLGFFTYAALFAGVGALTSKPEDLQQTNGIFTVPIIVAYMLSLLVLLDPDKPLVLWGSLIPMLSPMVMFARIATANVPTWQIAFSIAGSLIAIWLFTLLAGKLYRVGVLMYGKPLAPKEIWTALRSPV